MQVTAGLFPGQGSQSVGMGQVFFKENDRAKEIFSQADQVLGFSLSTLCLEGPLEQLTLTENTQPAILTVSYICYELADLELKAAAGHSLGEYTALVAAKAISFDDAVTLVHKRGRYMQEAVPEGEGKMLAVMGPSEEEIRSVIEGMSERGTEIANLNSPGQTVVAGSASSIDTFANLMKEKGAKVIPLNVSAPFHCSLMHPAADRLATDLDAISFNDPVFPVYSNVNASATNSGEQARELLKQQVTSSVRWTDSMLSMIEAEGIEATIEFGSGGVLTKLLKRINKTPSRLEISDPQSLAATKTALSGNA